MTVGKGERDFDKFSGRFDGANLCMEKADEL